jgi:uncharacterized protein YjbJ (UPF0337 family)
MKKQEAHRKARKVKGKAKGTVGIHTRNKKVEREGSLQRAAGAVQEGFGKAGRMVSDAVASLGDAVTSLGHAVKK